MNWEQNFLNRYYKTHKFKLNYKNPHSLKNKTEHVKKVTSYLERYCDEEMYVNKDGALYKKVSGNKTFYYDYSTNIFFWVYCHFFNEEYEMADPALELEAEKWKIVLLRLNHLKNENENDFLTYITDNINQHFQHKTYIIGHSISLYDVVLLSIIQNSNLTRECLTHLTHLGRWMSHVEKCFDINPAEVLSTKEGKSKEYLVESYKLISSSELLCAYQEGKYDVVISCLDNGLNVNSRELKEFKTLTHIACQRGDLDIVRILISYGADLNALDSELMTPLYDAILSQNIPLCDYLIDEMKMDINHKEIQDRTPFYWAACSGNLKMVEYLLSKPNVDFNNTSKMGRSPLSKACWNGKIEIVKRLCQIPGIITNCPDTNGRYPLHNAVWGQNGGRLGKKVSGINGTDSPECALFLIEAGAELEVSDNEGYTPLMISASTNGVESLKLLIAKGGNPNHLNNNGASALIDAVKYGNPDSVYILLTHAIDLKGDIKDNFGYDALQYSCLMNRLSCLEYLLEYKTTRSQVSLDSIGNLFELVVKSSSEECFIYLLNKYADLLDNIWLETILDRIVNNFCINMFNAFVDIKVQCVLSIYEHNLSLLVKTLILSYEIKNTQTDDTKEQEANEKFISNVCKLTLIYFQYASKNKSISYLLVKTFIYLEDKDNFLKVIDLLRNDDYTLTDDKLLYPKDNFSYIEVENKKIINKNIFESEWEENITTLQLLNPLALSLTEDDETYFNCLMNMKCFHHFIFEKVGETNILHILFERDHFDKLVRVIEIIETTYPDRLQYLLQMMKELNEEGLNPVDVLIRNKYFDLVEKYTHLINQTQLRNNICVESTIESHYRVQTFDIIDNGDIYLPTEYKQYLNWCVQSSTLKTASVGPDNRTYPVDKIIHSNQTLIASIIDQIENGNLKAEFRISNKNYNFIWIDTIEGLEECSHYLKSQQVIGVDLEYYGNNSDKDGIICVMQISSFEKQFAIDTIKLHSLINSSLGCIFSDENILKVFHGCDNDILFLITNYEIYTKNIFDTGRAFLVFQQSISNKSYKTTNLPSLNYLTKFFLKMEIDKSYQISDWRIRPLTKNMLQYALNDAKCVIYLFLIMSGLYLNLISDTKDCDTLYSNLKDQFNQFKDKVIDKEDNHNAYRAIMKEIFLRSHETIKFKIKEKNIKLSIQLK